MTRINQARAARKQFEDLSTNSAASKVVEFVQRDASPTPFVGQTADRRDRFRVGKCGKYQRSPESIARQKEAAHRYWSDESNRSRQSELTKARMARPGVSEKIAERTAAALADPQVKARIRAGLARAWADPEKRKQQSEITKAAMARWRADSLKQAEKVLRQLPRNDRESALAGLSSAARGGRA